MVTQKQVNEAVTNYIVRRNEPFTLVRDPHFKELIMTLQPTKHVMCYKTFKKNMNSDYEVMVKSLKAELAKQEFTAFTTDGWSHVHKSFLGKITFNHILRSFSIFKRSLSEQRFKK